MGKTNTKKPRKKYSDTHGKGNELFNMSKPMLLAMIHKPSGRKKLWALSEIELKRHPERAQQIANLRRNLEMYDQIQGVSSQSENPLQQLKDFQDKIQNGAYKVESITPVKEEEK